MPNLAQGFRSFKEGLNWKLIRAYWSAVWNRSWEIWWGAGVIGVICTVITIYYAPSRWILGWAVAWVFLVAGYFAWRADHVRLIPQLDVVATRLEDMQIPMNDVFSDVRTFCQLVPKCLTDSPVYECKGHLREVRRWAVDRWEVTDLGPVVLKWGNVQDQEVTLHPNAENVLNVCYIRHSDYQVVPYVDADLTWPKIYATFKRQPGGIEAYEFDICITYSHRVNGNFESVKPVNLCVELQTTNDPYKPNFEIKRKGV